MMKQRLFKRYIVPAVVIMLTVSCEKQNAAVAIYFPIDDLITEQIYYLTAVEASIDKVATLDDHQQKTSFKPADTTEWLKELNIFRSLDAINKPMNQNAYRVNEGIPDTKSNLKIKSFIAREDLPVEYIKVYYHDSPGNVRRIESKLNQANALYKTTRYLILEFQPIDNKNVLVSYVISGGQKIFLGDSVRYTITANISIP